MVLKTCHNYLTHHSFSLNQVSQVRMSQVGSTCGSFVLHMQSRGGMCSELSCLRSENLLSVANFIVAFFSYNASERIS